MILGAGWRIFRSMSRQTRPFLTLLLAARLFLAALLVVGQGPSAARAKAPEQVAAHVQTVLVASDRFQAMVRPEAKAPKPLGLPDSAPPLAHRPESGCSTLALPPVTPCRPDSAVRLPPSRAPPVLLS
ncbi:hypothetical protein C5F48_11535 [Cereibacter changlensis JA139]|uniref:Uncharacterized protein n=2 Tax=Cereibacter changlensis TaxID=402884 RepID=A0A2T4JUV8_9RHOB|nr:hypothetical protein [Cereibacter changlensis]PTE21553.1 hypothetical protein C5F48_11535 [Cereibacter changlensis JA139]